MYWERIVPLTERPENLPLKNTFTTGLWNSANS
jgi:hypothetical protein